MDTPIVITEHKWPSDTQPVVSIFNWVYNHKDYIRESIDSILMQKTTFRVEIIIHDDASNDGTAEIIKEYEVIYPKLFNNILQKENQWSQGKSVMTPLFERPKGKYVALAHGDDYWTDPHKLQKQVDFLENNVDCVISYHNCRRVNEKGEIFGQDIYSVNQPKSFYFVDAVNGHYTKTCTMTFRNILDFNTISYLDDIILCMELLKNGGFAGFISDNMAAYRYTDGGIWSRVNTFGKFILQEKTELHINYRFQNCEHKKLVNRRLINFYKIWAKLLFKDLHIFGFIKAISKYIKYETKRIIYKS